MTSAIIFDSETTGLDKPEIIETAWVAVDVAANVIPPGGQCNRWKPSKAIALGAMATHHVMDEDLAECPPASSFKLPDGVEYLIGHNVDFDWRAIGEPPVRRIDVLSMCRALWPDADSHSQGAMLYLLERDHAREDLKRAHSAAADVMNCRKILSHVIAKAGPFETFEQLWQASERMRIPRFMPYGKHKGEPISRVPRDYRAWLSRQPDVDPYLLIALRAMP
jgi:exodeoxyribonuclease X